eukprot:2736743-Pleurochrysis_carterae.AAC.1
MVANSNIWQHLPVTGVEFHLMFAFNAMDTSHSQGSFSAPATGLTFPEETPNKVELKDFLESFQDAMGQKPYGAMLRGKL